MRGVRIECLVRGVPRREVYETLKDTDVYRRNAQSRVKHVDVTPMADGSGAITNWEVYFRNGLLTWSERDVYFDEDCVLKFEQLDGDFDQFRGSWTVLDGAQSGEVRLLFAAFFDFGVPSLDPIVSPVAARVLTQTMSHIVLETFPGASIVAPSGSFPDANATREVPSLQRSDVRAETELD
jgi:Polyketide cyclase / dehydrase and lipid transport